MKKHIKELTPPLLGPQHIKEKIVCIRSHRERLFRVSHEKIGKKHIFHNYGHGGAGWTFLFGCVNESLRQFDRCASENVFSNSTKIAIIGAGCYGLLTAILLAQKGHSVCIYAKEIENIPSYKAAGFFFPRPRKMSTPQEISVFESLGIESFKAYQQIAYGDHPFITAGAKLLPAYFGVDIDPRFGPYIKQDLMPQPRPLAITFDNTIYHNVMEYQSLFINSSIMMEELHHMVNELAIQIIKQEIISFDEITENIIFNCAGMGAKKLTNDGRIIPVQGHLITLAHQFPLELRNYMINVKVLSTSMKGTPRDELIYYAPKESGILGITFLRGVDSETAHLHEFDRLLERSRKFFGL